jgi:hypothetical protein
MAVELTAVQAEQIHAALARGQKIAAIKLYREFTGADLKASKETIDQLSGELFQRDPSTYATLAPRGAGCASVVAVVLALATSSLAAWVWRSAIMLILLGVAGCASVSKPLAGEAPSQLPALPAGQSWQLVWHDEFNGATLDPSRWDAPEYERRGHLWRAANAYLDGKGNAILETSKVGDRYASPCIRTKGKFEKAFGYFEMRCRLPTEPGHWSAFWLYNDSVGKVGDEGRDGTEIDIMEWPYRDGRVPLTLHWDGYGKEHKSEGSVAQQSAVLDGQFHTFALWWTPTEYVFYIDSVEVWRTRAGGVCQVPLYVKLSEEIGPWAGEITKAALPDRFVVDYVRVYDVQGP